MIERITPWMVHSGAGWVLMVIIALSVVCVGIAIERALAFGRPRDDIAVLVPQLRRLLRDEDRAGAVRALEASRSVAGRVVAAGIADADRGAAAAREAMAAALGLEQRRLEKHLIILGTIGNNAPFVGLLGTVIGVVGAFDALGKPETTGAALAAASALAPERVMGAIAEALVATALGLLVAIPAVAVFNYFQARAAAALADAETLGHVLLARLRAETERSSHPRVRRELAGSEGTSRARRAEGAAE